MFHVGKDVTFDPAYTVLFGRLFPVKTENYQNLN